MKEYTQKNGLVVKEWQFYRTRGQQKAFVYRIRGVGQIVIADIIIYGLVTPHRSYLTPTKYTRSRDLISEWKEPLKQAKKITLIEFMRQFGNMNLNSPEENIEMISDYLNSQYLEDL